MIGCCSCPEWISKPSDVLNFLSEVLQGLLPGAHRTAQGDFQAVAVQDTIRRPTGLVGPHGEVLPRADGLEIG